MVEICCKSRSSNLACALLPIATLSLCVTSAFAPNATALSALSSIKVLLPIAIASIAFA
nr:hypothetical protein [Mergibacter septicus]